MPLVDAQRLDELLAKERAHDDYLEALKETKDREATLEAIVLLGTEDDEDPFGAFVDGYRAARHDIMQATVDAASRRAAEG